MRRVCLAIIISFLASNAIAQPDPSGEKDHDKERLGVRVGYVGTTSRLDKTFGGGLNLALHFIQRIKKPLSVDVTFGAYYLGRTSRQDITLDVFGTTYDETTMRIVTTTVAPMLELPIDDRTNLYLSAGIGLYIVSLLLDESFFEFDVSNNHFGVNGGVGVFRRVSKNWAVDLNFQAHKFWTSADRDDMFYRYSEGDGNPIFYQVAAGVTLRLF